MKDLNAQINQFDDWNKKIIRLLWHIIIYIAFFEVFFLFKSAVMDKAYKDYSGIIGHILKYIILPFSINIIMTLIPTIIYTKTKLKGSIYVNRAILFAVIGICVNVTAIHRYYVSIFTCLVAPIFFATIYENERLVIETTIFEILIFSVVELMLRVTNIGPDGVIISLFDVTILILILLLVMLGGILIIRRANEIKSKASISEDKFRKLFTSLPVGFLQTNVTYNDKINEYEYKIAIANDIFYEYLETNSELAKNRPIRELMFLTELGIKRGRTLLHDVINGEDDAVVTREIYIEKIDKYFNLFAYKNDKNSVNIIFSDITNLKSIERDLELAIDNANSAYKTQSDFLANMSHELRTPINGIMGMLELAILSNNIQNEDKDYLLTAKECSHSLLKIVNDILNYTKIETGKYILNHDKFIFKDLIQRVIDFHYLMANKKELQFKYQLPSEIPSIFIGDAEKLEQIISYILNNAIKFTDNGSVELNLKVHKLTDSQVNIKMCVTDTGIGIAESYRDKIFERFSQMDGSNTRKYGGTGLGLAITKDLVEFMGGTIEFESELGKGSIFTIQIPFEIDTESKWIDSYLEEIDLEKIEKVNVLIAEDEPVNQRVITKFLERANYNVDIAENGFEAVAMFKAKDYDICLMDIQMPVMDGLEASKQIKDYQKKIGRKKIVPIVAVTAKALVGDRERILASGLDEYISKPYDYEQVITVIESLLV